MKNISLIKAAIATTLVTLAAVQPVYADDHAAFTATEKVNVPLAHNFMAVVQRSELQNWMTKNKIKAIEIKKRSGRFGHETISVLPEGLYKKYKEIIISNGESREPFSFINAMLPDTYGLTIQLKSTDKGQLYLTFSDMNLNNADVDFQNLNNLLKNPIFQQSYVKDVNDVVSGLELKLSN